MFNVPIPVGRISSLKERVRESVCSQIIPIDLNILAFRSAGTMLLRCVFFTLKFEARIARYKYTYFLFACLLSCAATLLFFAHTFCCLHFKCEHVFSVWHMDERRKKKQQRRRAEEPLRIKKMFVYVLPSQWQWHWRKQISTQVELLSTLVGQTVWIEHWNYEHSLLKHIFM